MMLCWMLFQQCQIDVALSALARTRYCTMYIEPYCSGSRQHWNQSCVFSPELEYADLMPRNLGEIVVESEENAKGEEEGEGGDEVPHVVVIVEIEQNTFGILFSRLSRRHVPGEDVKEEFGEV